MLAARRCNRVISREHDDRADDRNNHAVEVETGDAFRAEDAEQYAADNSTDDTEDDIEKESLALFVHNLAGDEAGDETQDEPTDDRHVSILPMRTYGALAVAAAEIVIAVDVLLSNDVRSLRRNSEIPCHTVLDPTDQQNVR
jgi:hypothetical protein